MENVIVYQSQLNESKELTEYFHHLGYEPLLTDKPLTLLTAYSRGIFSKVYLELCSFSDILLIDSIKAINSKVNIVLIVKPGLKDIIDILQNNSYQIINSIMSVPSTGQ